ncbi:hypothetical protein CK203_113656 [Vitis vinifera]|uniref:Uncharacterized protein n=1 Tax=Vitis vinifera TaxID=29760 RepID=A0A438EG59_VITVI|nr:hypothetical protein CK203_113656 [Vitis vinifera]
MTAASGLFLIPTAARASLIQHPKFYLEWKDKTFSSISSTFAASSRTRNRRRVSVSTHFCCNSLLSDLAPATSAAYGAMLLGGGVFAYTRSGSKGSLFGGFTGAALMATVSVIAALFLNYYTLFRYTYKRKTRGSTWRRPVVMPGELGFQYDS